MLKLTSFNHFGDEALEQVREALGKITISYIEPSSPSDRRDSPRIDKFLSSKKGKKSLYFGWFEYRIPSDLYPNCYNVSGTLMISGCGTVTKHFLPTEFHLSGYIHEIKEGRYHKETIERFTSTQVKELFVPIFEKLKQPHLF